MLKRRVYNHMTDVDDARFIQISNGCIQSTGSYMETAKSIEAGFFDCDLKANMRITVSVVSLFEFYIKSQRNNHKYSCSFDTLRFGTRVYKDGRIDSEIDSSCFCKTKSWWDESRQVWILSGIYSLGGDPLVTFKEITKEEYNTIL